MDPLDQVWEECPPLPRARVGFAVAAAGGRLYLLGGTDEEDLELNSVEAYDPSAGTWLRGVPHMLKARTGAVAATICDEVYVAGGNGGDTYGYLGAAEYLNVTVHKWIQLPPMHVSRADAAATSNGGHMYVAGGRDGGAVLSAVERYNPDKTCWEALADMSTPRAHCAAAALGDGVLVVGGFNDAVYLDSAEWYDLSSGHWEPVAPMACPRSGAGAVTVGGAVYVFGGWNEGKVLDNAERYDPIPEERMSVPDYLVRVTGMFYMRGPDGQRDEQPDGASGDPEAAAGNRRCSHTSLDRCSLLLSTTRDDGFYDIVETEQKCFICYDRSPDAVLLECGHSGICVQCALRLTQNQGRRLCPICRCLAWCILRIFCESGNDDHSKFQSALESGRMGSTKIKVTVVGMWTSLEQMPRARASFGIAVC